MAVSIALPWHEGEEKMHRLMHVPEYDNPTASMLTPQAANMLQRGPLIAIGTLDKENRPWTTLWGGASGLSQPLAPNIIGVKTMVDSQNDPVINTLFGEHAQGEVVKEGGEGRMIGALTIDLDTRKRVKVYGRMIAGAVSAINTEGEAGNPADANEVKTSQQGNNHQEQAQVQLCVRIDQSLGNCPKYLNRKQIHPAAVSSTLVSASADLPEEAQELVRKSDLFFVSSSHSSFDMDTNHRGGPAGFVRLRKNTDGKWELFWPEYSGNRLYQTLGNLQATPLAGLVFPDFDTGNVLYVTGETTVLIEADAAREIPHSNLAVKLTISEARFVKQGLPFRGIEGEPSPYNPKVRPLTSEASLLTDLDKENESRNVANLIRIDSITPTIARYVFNMEQPDAWQAGQWVALDFSHHMDTGYSHMRDDDPLSLNDDWVRTFTVSSTPLPGKEKNNKGFEMTIRKVGAVTTFLSRQKGGHSIDVDIPILGFGGSVSIVEDSNGKITPFVAGGVGITPLLGQLPVLDTSRLNVFWTLHVEDLAFVTDILDKYPTVGPCFFVYVTGIKSGEDTPEHLRETMERIKTSGVTLETRRMQKNDLVREGLGDKWNICVSGKFRSTLIEWLAGKEVIYEDFNF